MNKITIIELNRDVHGDLLKHVCAHLFVQWKRHYNNLFGIHDVQGLVKFYHQNPQLVMYVALQDDGTFVGCYSITKKGSLYWLTDMYVVPQHRKKGLGRMLVEHATKDCNNVALNTQEENVAFYERQGFIRGLQYQQRGATGETFEYYHMYYKKEPRFDASIIVIAILITIALGIVVILYIL